MKKACPKFTLSIGKGDALDHLVFQINASCGFWTFHEAEVLPTKSLTLSHVMSIDMQSAALCARSTSIDRFISELYTLRI